LVDEIQGRPRRSENMEFFTPPSLTISPLEVLAPPTPAGWSQGLAFSKARRSDHENERLEGIIGFCGMLAQIYIEPNFSLQNVTLGITDTELTRQTPPA